MKKLQRYKKNLQYIYPHFGQYYTRDGYPANPTNLIEPNYKKWFLGPRYLLAFFNIIFLIPTFLITLGILVQSVQKTEYITISMAVYFASIFIGQMQRSYYYIQCYISRGKYQRYFYYYYTLSMLFWVLFYAFTGWVIENMATMIFLFFLQGLNYIIYSWMFFKTYQRG